MILGTVKTAQGTRAFKHEGDATEFFDVPDVAALIEQKNWRCIAGEAGDFPDAEDLTIPVLQPRKILCIGLNYRDHAVEVGKEPPTMPTVFSKVATSLVGPREDIEYPTLSSEVDWEGELVIVIGKKVKNADIESARDAILGYSIMNDVSVRDWQKRTSEWFQGKNFDSTTPVGPYIVTADSIDPSQGLRVQTKVNDQTKQDGTTKDMLFKPDELIVYLSQFLTLEPGDLIATGTPAGVGSGRTPASYLQKGDLLVTSIEGIGELRNRLA